MRLKHFFPRKKLSNLIKLSPRTKPFLSASTQTMSMTPHVCGFRNKLMENFKFLPNVFASALSPPSSTSIPALIFILKASNFHHFLFSHLSAMFLLSHRHRSSRTRVFQERTCRLDFVASYESRDKHFDTRRNPVDLTELGDAIIPY